MTASEITRIVATVGTVQLLCNIVSYWMIFRQDQYNRALSNVTRMKTKLDKEKASFVAESTSTATTTATSKRGKKLDDKHQKRLKRAEDDHADAVGFVARMHIFPNIITSIVFIVLLRVLGMEMKGKVVGVLPFSPFKLLQKVTARGLDFGSNVDIVISSVVHEDGSSSSTADSISSGLKTSQACSFMFIYLLCTFSIKFYINKLFGTTPPPGSGDGGIMEFVDSPQGQKIAQAFGVERNDWKTD